MQEASFTYRQEFKLESGGVLPEFTLQYSSLGTLNEQADNVIWVCHALTANSDFSDWWGGLIEKQFDPNQYYLICVNMLGGCYGSTGPLSVNPQSSGPYFHEFPDLTNRDIVHSFDLLRQHLGIKGIHTAIGGSMGGQQALEWSIMQPALIQNLVLVATNAQHSPWGIAYNESQRMAIELDPTWQQNTASAGMNGMKAARATALLSYRSYQTYQTTQAEDSLEKTNEFKAASYQRYQGEKLYRRFNAYTYWHLSKAMDAHNVGRGRETVEKALAKVRAQTIVIGIRSDQLFPLTEQRLLAIPNSEYHEIDSIYGHDGFLLELDQISAILNGVQKQNSQKLSVNG